MEGGKERGREGGSKKIDPTLQLLYSLLSSSFVNEFSPTTDGRQHGAFTFLVVVFLDLNQSLLCISQVQKCPSLGYLSGVCLNP